MKITIGNHYLILLISDLHYFRLGQTIDVFVLQPLRDNFVRSLSRVLPDRVSTRLRVTTGELITSVSLLELCRAKTGLYRSLSLKKRKSLELLGWYQPTLVLAWHGYRIELCCPHRLCFIVGVISLLMMTKMLTRSCRARLNVPMWGWQINLSFFWANLENFDLAVPVSWILAVSIKIN